MTITYVDLHRNHGNDTLGWMPDCKEDDKDELDGQIDHATLDDDIDRGLPYTHGK
jgi:hypothetical protein